MPSSQLQRMGRSCAGADPAAGPDLLSGVPLASQSPLGPLASLPQKQPPAQSTAPLHTDHLLPCSRGQVPRSSSRGARSKGRGDLPESPIPPPAQEQAYKDPNGPRDTAGPAPSFPPGLLARPAVCHLQGLGGVPLGERAPSGPPDPPLCPALVSVPMERADMEWCFLVPALGPRRSFIWECRTGNGSGVEVCRRSACGPRGPKPLQFSPALPQHALVPVARAQLVLAPTVVVGGGSGWGRHRGQGQVLALPRKVLECIVLEPGYVAMPSHLEDGKGVRAPHGPACSCTFLSWGWREAAEAGSSPASAQQTVLGEQAAVARCLRRQTTSLPPPAGGGLAETGSSTLVCLGQSMLRAQDGLCQ